MEGCVGVVELIVVVDGDAHANTNVALAASDRHNVVVALTRVGLQRDVERRAVGDNVGGIAGGSDVGARHGLGAKAAKVALNEKVVGLEDEASVGDLGSKVIVQLSAQHTEDAVDVPAESGRSDKLLATGACGDL